MPETEGFTHEFSKLVEAQIACSDMVPLFTSSRKALYRVLSLAREALFEARENLEEFEKRFSRKYKVRRDAPNRIELIVVKMVFAPMQKDDSFRSTLGRYAGLLAAFDKLKIERGEPTEDLLARLGVVKILKLASKPNGQRRQTVIVALGATVVEDGRERILLNSQEDQKKLREAGVTPGLITIKGHLNDNYALHDLQIAVRGKKMGG